MKEKRRSIHKQTAKKLKALLYRTFDLVLTRFSVESQYSGVFIKLLFGIQFGLSAATFRSLYILAADEPLNEQILPEGFVVVMSYACWAYFLTMVALHVDAFVHAERMASKSISYVISCYMTIVYTYVVHPLMIWVFMNSFTTLSAKSLSLAFEHSAPLLNLNLTLIIFGQLFICLALYVRNDLPVAGGISVRLPSSDVLTYSFQFICKFFGFFSLYSSDNEVIRVFFLVVVLALVARIGWDLLRSW